MASFNFCEKDHLHHEFIVEYYNTISNIPIILLGAYGSYYHYKLHKKYNINFLILICIGFGSMFFHATMSRIGQLFDEIPMIWLNSFLLNEMFPFFIWFIMAFGISIFYSIFYQYKIFLIYFSLTGLFVFFTPMILRKSDLAKKILRISMFLFIAGFCCWILDNTMCTMFHDYYLHAWWHILAGISIYYYIQFQLALKPCKIYKNFPIVIKISCD